MNKNAYIAESANVDAIYIDFDDLENQLEASLQEQLSDVIFLESEREKIGNPNSLGDVVMNVVWEQFINQVGVVAGEDFIKENRGLTLDLRKDAHIQTTENFADGKIATHNTSIDYQQRYDDWQDKFQRNEDGSIKMENARITREPQAKLKSNARSYLDGPKGSASMHNDHTVPAAEIIRDPQANAHLSPEEQRAFAIGEKNYKPLDASANESKRDSKMEDWLNYERNGQKPADRFNIDEEELRERDRIAREEYERVKAEGERRSVETGKASRRAEAFRISGKALRVAIMALLADLVKNIIRKLVSWLRSADKSLKSFINKIKESIHDFLHNMKNNLLHAGDSVLTSIFTAIFGPIISVIKKAWIAIKQGYKSLKEALNYLKNPENRQRPFSILLLEVGKIVIAGLTATGAIVLSEVIEKGLMTIPVFAFHIPLLGSLANILGIFFGALTSGLVGALLLNLIDKLIAKKQKRELTCKAIEKKDKILATQELLIDVSTKKMEHTKSETAQNISERHRQAHDMIQASLNNITNNGVKEGSNASKNNEDIESIFSTLNNL